LKPGSKGRRKQKISKEHSEKKRGSRGPGSLSFAPDRGSAREPRKEQSRTRLDSTDLITSKYRSDDDLKITRVVTERFKHFTQGRRD